MKLISIEGKWYLAKEKGHRPTEFMVKSGTKVGYISLSKSVSVPKELEGQKIQLRVEVIEND